MTNQSLTSGSRPFSHSKPRREKTLLLAMGLVISFCLTACQQPTPAKTERAVDVTPSHLPAGELTVAEHTLIASEPDKPFEVIYLSQNQGTEQVVEMITAAQGEVRAVDYSTGVVLAKVSGEFAAKFEAINKELGHLAYVSKMAISKNQETRFAEESVNPLTGRDLHATDVVVQPIAHNHQLPTEEMGVSELKQYIQTKYGFTPNGDSVKIAIIDTGVDLAHRQVFQDRIISSWDVTADGRIKLESAIVDKDNNLLMMSQPAGGPEDLTPIPLNTSDLQQATEYYLGWLQEASYSNEDGIIDINQDGDLSSRFQVLMIRGLTGYRVAVDTNNNHDFSDETFVGNYEDNFETVIMDAAKHGVVRMNFNIPTHTDGTLHRSANGEIVISAAGFDSSRHGTHVASIAAGQFLAPQFSKQFQGGAPAARIIAIKALSTNTSSESDIIAGVLLAAEKKADIVNMSLATIGVISDGQDVLAQTIDRTVRAHKMTFIIAAGNSGPGMLTVAAPSSANLAISVGAAVTGETLKSIYNQSAVRAGHYMWSFSSVGPSVINHGKPTLVAPGSAYAAVPLAKNRLRPQDDAVYDVYQGTSMAAPAVTGVTSLILDAVKKINAEHNDPILAEDPRSIELALIEGAISLNELNAELEDRPKYHRIEEGAGHISAINSFKALEQRSPEPTAEYKVWTKSWNTAYKYPTQGIFTTRPLPKKISFDISKVENGTDDTDFYKVFKVESTVKWLRVPHSMIPITATNVTTFSAEVDQEAINSFPPGLYEGQFILRDSESGQLEQTINITYLKAHEITNLGDQNQFIRTDVHIIPGGIQRYFFYIPQGKSSLSFQMETARYENGELTPNDYSFRIIGPTGKALYTSNEKIGGQQNMGRLDVVAPTPGTYELTVFRRFNSQQLSDLTLSVRTTDVVVSPSQWHPSPLIWNKKYRQDFEVINYGPDIVGVASGQIDRVTISDPAVMLHNTKTTIIPILIPPGVESLTIQTDHVDQAPNADIDLSLYDGEGNRLGTSTGSTAREEISVGVKPGQKLELKISAYDLGQDQGTVDVVRTFKLMRPIPIKTNLQKTTLEWMRTTRFSAQLDLEVGFYQYLLDHLAQAKAPVYWLGGIGIFESTQGVARALQRIPIKAQLTTDPNN